MAVEVEREGLIEPDVIVSHQVVLGQEIRELPVDNVEEIVELTTGVTDGHFRGGRVGQENYRIDGLELKNQLESARQGPAFELSPSSLEELEVMTGGFGADNGAALSGIVSYVTRRGSTERWEGRGSFSTDVWTPDDIYLGFTGLSLSAGGPLGLLGEGSTLFADVLAQGKIDAEPRARGLTCLGPEDADSALALAITSLQNNSDTADLVCPYTSPRLPYQRGDKLIAFARLDRPLWTGTNLTLSLLYNRRQFEQYTSEFKYNPDHQLGQRNKGLLGTLTLDWARYSQSSAFHLVGRVAAMRLDRYLGALDPWTFNERGRVAGFGLSDFRFLGEDFVRSPIDEQLESSAAVPGYLEPGGVTGSPFGPAAEGIFFTEGTPEIANWSRSEFISGDVIAEQLWAGGHAIRGGGTARFYEIENYERVRSYLPGSSPNFTRFYPATVNGWVELYLLAAHDVTVRLGLRVEAFRSGLDFQQNRADFLAPAIDSEWKTVLMPRIGMAVPLPTTNGRTMFRLNYGIVSQPPDFTFFLDSTIGDSLRTDIRRQGNPNLAFERGASWELGMTQLLAQRFAIDATIFYKELNNLVTSSLSFRGFEENQFTGGDFGTIRGLELNAEARWPAWRARLGYSLQEAQGVTSGAFEDPGAGLTERRIEFPLAFDRRHAIDMTLLVGRAAQALDRKWGFSLIGSIRSGFPLNRTFEELSIFEFPEVEERLPWTHVFNVRVSRYLGRLLGCSKCGWRVMAEVRNLFGEDNVIALRRDTGTIAPTVDELAAIAAEVPDDMVPIPQESPGYSALTDLNADGFITAQEMQTARFAAALDRNDPSLFFDEPRQIRLGLEISF